MNWGDVLVVRNIDLDDRKKALCRLKKDVTWSLAVCCHSSGIEGPTPLRNGLVGGARRAEAGCLGG
jgi:hypothetical protein